MDCNEKKVNQSGRLVYEANLRDMCTWPCRPSALSLSFLGRTRIVIRLNESSLISLKPFYDLILFNFLLMLGDLLWKARPDLRS